MLVASLDWSDMVSSTNETSTHQKQKKPHVFNEYPSDHDGPHRVRKYTSRINDQMVWLFAKYRFGELTTWWLMEIDSRVSGHR